MAANANGSRFQLLTSSEDWLVASTTSPTPDGSLGRVAWEAQRGLTLQPLLTLFPAPAGERPLDPSQRRGAEADAHGNWYWISNDRRSVYWLPRAGRPAVYWTPPASQPRSSSGSFGPATDQRPAASMLAGLAVTEHQYLIVGDLVAGGMLAFDLRAGGEPELLLFDRGTAFEPFDIAATAGGGFFVLDRRQRTLWRLDRNFCVAPLTGAPPAPAAPLPDAGLFGPLDGEPHIARTAGSPAGLPLIALDPIAITSVSPDEVLVLGAEPAGAPSRLYRYRNGLLMAQLELTADVEAEESGIGHQAARVSVAAHDLAYEPVSQRVYVVSLHGKQVIAMVLDLGAAEHGLQVQPTFLPLHYFGGRALSLFEGQMHYDVIARDRTRDALVRWVKVQDTDQARYYREAVVETPVWDGKDRDCVWDRVYLDACIPPECALKIASRASNEPDLISALPFDAEPPLYLRGGGSEIPYYDAYADESPLRPNTGTWEVLLQGARGRYVQLEITLAGNGRATPAIRALRATYPRFSYPRRYLPAVYLEDSESAWFLERFLANPEGFFTDLEGKVRDIPLQFDARTASPDALDWLAGWLGIVMDPIWEQLGARRRTGRQGNRPAYDRRRLLMRYALRLYSRRGTPDGIRLALHLLLDPFLEECLDRFRMAATVHNEALAAELAALGISYPGPAMTDAHLEELMLAYLLAPARPSKIRIVEHFLTRGGRAAVQGDADAPSRAVGDEVRDFAHGFSVLIPEDLSVPEAAMVSRLVDLEKPAHTLFDVRRYWDFFMVGQARMGIDTVLGDDRRFAPTVLGQSYVSEGYLAGVYPQEETDRVILDRDGPFSMPPL